MTKLVLWSSSDGDVPADLAFFNNYSATTNPGASDDKSFGYQRGSVWVNKSTGAAYMLVDDTLGTAVWKLLDPAALTNPVLGVAAGYKIARGVHVQVAASDTVVSGLATVVAVVASFRDAPTVKQLLCSATIGDQAGAPAAGSFLLRTYKPTAVNDVTPTAATDFTDNIGFNWEAVGT